MLFVRPPTPFNFHFNASGGGLIKSRSPQTMLRKPAVFLDLQGTLGGEGLGDIRDFTLFECAIPAIKLINKIGLPVVVVTNQSHNEKGDFTIQYFRKKVDALKEEVKKAGARIEGVYCCPHCDDSSCDCRKPKPGLIFKACHDLSVDASISYVVGDCGSTDMLMAYSIGCKKIIVKTGLGGSSLGEFRYTWLEVEPDFIADDVLEAAKWIVEDRANCKV